MSTDEPHRLWIVEEGSNVGSNPIGVQEAIDDLTSTTQEIFQASAQGRLKLESRKRKPGLRHIACVDTALAEEKSYRCIPVSIGIAKMPTHRALSWRTPGVDGNMEVVGPYHNASPFGLPR